MPHILAQAALPNARKQHVYHIACVGAETTIPKVARHGLGPVTGVVVVVLVVVVVVPLHIVCVCHTPPT